jgi:hypothetical protein
VIAIFGLRDTLIGSLKVAVIITISPFLYGDAVEYVIAAVGGVTSYIQEN